jgi:pyruvate formate lyase activating enzyme
MQNPNFLRNEMTKSPEELEGLLELPTVRPALLWEKVQDGKVRCGLCERRCEIREGSTGFCRTRVNISGRLYTMVYGDISSLSANPAEKKPFYHFYPGKLFLTAGTYGCTFRCPWCQNASISQAYPNPREANYISPEHFVRISLEEGCVGTSLSFNEPTLLFEYALDLFPLAHEEGLLNTFVSNGYMTLEALRMLRDAGLDAINIDVKGDAPAVRKYCAAEVEPVWRNVREAKRLGMHVEVVNLVVPGVNDREEQFRELARRHLREAGDETPLHFTAYYPAYKFDAPPTPVATLELARSVAVGEGLKFVYIGNVPGHRYENTYCPTCGRLLVRRYGLELVEVDLEDRKCPSCGREIPIVGGGRTRGWAR